VRREYSFDKNGNRTKLKTSSSTGGNCFYAGLDSETDFTYDALDRPLKAADGTDYEYDSFGRQTLIPEADAPVNDAGDISLTYFDDDLARSITQDGVTTTFELDALARRTTSTITNNPTVTRHYGDDSDNPAWTTNSDGAVMRNAGSLDGLGAIVFGDGSAALTIGNPHGDNVTTVILPVGHAETTAAVSISGWADYDEYGVTKSNYPQGVTYGWLGKHERSASIESAGLTLMGVRLYNPIRGAFTSVDPVRGGNTTAYTYPQDPVNVDDLSGACPVCLAVPVVPVGAILAVGATALVISGVLITMSKSEKRFGFTVPFPSIKLSKKGKTHRVYVMRFLDKTSKAWKVWKYGETKNGAKRPNSQLPTCRRTSGGDCRWNWIGGLMSHWAARALEAQLIYNYLVKHKTCPPGHNPGRLKVCR
jgi:RHS repeat-associated protein